MSLRPNNFRVSGHQTHQKFERFQSQQASSKEYSASFKHHLMSRFHFFPVRDITKPHKRHHTREKYLMTTYSLRPFLLRVNASPWAEKSMINAVFPSIHEWMLTLSETTWSNVFTPMFLPMAHAENTWPCWKISSTSSRDRPTVSGYMKRTWMKAAKLKVPKMK